MRFKFPALQQRTLDELYSRPDENIVVRCRRCRRTLRDPARRAARIGRVCLAKSKILNPKS